MAKKKNIPGVDPRYLEKQKASLLRTHRQVIRLNKQEMDAINEYCRRYKISSRAPVLRQAIMEHILAGLDEGHPTLF